MTTPLEKKSAEIAALVAALSVRIRRNSNERCFEYRCSEHHEWQHLCYGSDDSDIRKALAELQRVEAARRAWPDRVERASWNESHVSIVAIHSACCSRYSDGCHNLRRALTLLLPCWRLVPRYS